MPMTELTSELLQDGEFCERLTDKLQEVGRALCGYRDQFANAPKAKGKVVVTIELHELKAQSRDVECYVGITVTLPVEPKSADVLTFGQSDTDDRATLFCNAQGASHDHPSQERLDLKDSPEATET